MKELKYNCQCLCGKVNYNVILDNLDFSICHCSMCRKNTGGTGFSYFYTYCQPNFSSSDFLSTYNAQNIAERVFCNQCGTLLYYRHFESNGYCIPIGVVDNLSEEKVKLVSEWYYQDKPSYYDYNKETKKYLKGDINNDMERKSN